MSEPSQEYRLDLHGQRALDFHKQRALAAARELSIDALATNGLDTLVAEVMERWAPSPVVVHLDRIWLESREVESPADEASAVPAPLLVSLNIPCEGSTSLLESVEPRVCGSAGTVVGQGGQFGYAITITAQLHPDAGVHAADLHSILGETKAKWTAAVQDAAACVNAAVDGCRVEMLTEVSDLIAIRCNRIAALHEAAAASSIRLTPELEPTVQIPVQPRALTLEQVERSRQRGVSEYTLARDIAEAIVTTIHSFSLALQRLPVTAGKLMQGDEEETIRDLLLFILNANWRGLAMGEAFLGVGKSDILLRWQDRDAFIAECKIWSGQGALREGVDQLLGRYTVWRDTNVALVVVIRNRSDITAIIRKAVAELHASDRYISHQPPANDSEPVVFRMRAETDAQREVTLTFIPIPVPRNAGVVTPSDV